MWGREEVILSNLVSGGVVVVVVDAKVNNELVMRGSMLKDKGVDPGERVWSLRTAGMRVGGCRAEPLS